MNSNFSRLKRPRYRMPDYVRRTLTEKKLMRAYKSRPAYQQNDYLSWITRAKLAQTKLRRLNQMLDELEQGDRYMNMVFKKKS